MTPDDAMFYLGGRVMNVEMFACVRSICIMMTKRTLSSATYLQLYLWLELVCATIEIKIIDKDTEVNANNFGQRYPVIVILPRTCYFTMMLQTKNTLEFPKSWKVA